MKNLNANSNKGANSTKSLLLLSLFAFFLTTQLFQAAHAGEVNPMLTERQNNSAESEAKVAAARGVASDAKTESRTKVVTLPHRMGAQEDRRNQ